MNKYLSGLGLIAALFFTLTANAREANEPHPLSLADAVNFAIHNNPSLKNAKLDILIQKAQNAQLAATAYPRISAKGDFTDYIDPMKSFIPGDFIGQPGTFVPVQFTPKYAAGAAMSGSQIIFDGSLFVALAARKEAVKLATERGKLTEEGVKLNVQKAYYALVLAQKQFGILKNTLANARDMAHEQDVMRKNGFIEKIDMDRTQVQLNNLASDSMRIDNMLEVSEQLLKYQMGMDLSEAIVLTDTILENHIRNAAAMTAEETNYDLRTEYKLLNSQLRLTEFNLKRYKNVGLPTLSAFGSMGYNYSTNKFSEIFKSQYVWNSLVGLTLNVPIFNGFQRTNQVKEAKYNIEKTKNDIEQVKLTIDFQTENAKTTLRNALIQVENQKRNLELSNSVLSLAQRKYKEGVGSNLEVTQAQTDYLKSQNSYFSSLLDIVNAEADLQKALGQL